MREGDQVYKDELKKVISEIPAKVFGFPELPTYAVMIPIVDVDGEPSVLFEVRSAKLRRQPGEISFPGGKVEVDDLNPQKAAVRETCEELGIASQQIEVIGHVGVLVPPAQIAVYAYVGWIDAFQDEQLNEDEVAEVFSVPLSYLLSVEPEVYYLKLSHVPDENFPFHLIPGGKDYKFRKRDIPEYFYFYEDRVIWGLTARILKQFLDHLKKMGDIFN